MPKPQTERDLRNRRAPLQERARRTYERILDASAELLEQRGLEGINTNAIAERAGVNISAVYKYFPNKHAILATLAERLNARQTELVLTRLSELSSGSDWRELLAEIIDVMVAGTRHTPGLVPLQKAMQAVPALKDAYRAANDRVAGLLLKALARGGVDIPPARRRLVGQCLGEIAEAMLDLSVSRGKRFDPRVIEELKRIQIGYVETYLREAEPRS